MNPCAALLLLALLAPQAQDPADAKANEARIKELKKQLGSPDEAARVAAVKKLAEAPDREALTLLVAKLGSADNDVVRGEAARALGKFRSPASCQALGVMVQASLKNEKLLRPLVDALCELDMCASVPHLLAALEAFPPVGEAALAGLAKIGCGECAPGLIKYLFKAEVEEKKPDTVTKLPDPMTGAVGGTMENKNKDHTLAGLAKKTRELLALLSGKTYPDQKAWAASLGRGEFSAKRNSLYICEAEKQTFELPSGKSKTCGLASKATHEDVFLKHKKE